jgi:hypothetical protein
MTHMILTFLDGKLSAESYKAIVRDFASRSENLEELMNGFERINVDRDRDEKSGYGTKMEGSALSLLFFRYVENHFNSNTADNTNLMNVMRKMVLEHGAKIEESGIFNLNRYTHKFSIDNETCNFQGSCIYLLRSYDLHAKFQVNLFV